MGNVLQRFVYNTSVIAPLMIVLSIVWFQQYHTLLIPILLIITSIVLAVLFCCSFLYATKKAENILLNVTEVQPKDGWVIAYIITYAFPFSSIVLEDFSVILSGALALVIVIVMMFANTSIPHPLLFFQRYHFYAISTENGVAEYVFISKNKAIRNSEHIKQVKRMFEYLLIDSQEGK